MNIKAYKNRSLEFVKEFYRTMIRRGHSRGDVIEMLDEVDNELGLSKNQNSTFLERDS